MSDGGSLDDMNSQYIELPKGESSSQGGIDLPGKIRRQDTFGDEFYESWEKNVSVESTQTATGGNQDSDGFLSFATNSEGGQKRYREVEDEGKEIEEAESVDEDEDDADYLRNEVEKWKQLAGELKDQVLHLRATVSPAGSNRSGNQQKRKKLKRGLRYHQAAATEEVDCEAENDSMPTTPQSSTPRTPPSSFNQSPRQSKATPPKSKSMKRGNLS